jgi:hypothetical protein
VEAISATFDARERSGSIGMRESKEATGVPEAISIERTRGRQRPVRVLVEAPKRRSAS